MMLAIIGGHEQVAVAIIEAGADLALRGCGPPGFNAKTALDFAHEQQLETVLEALERRSPTM